MRSPIVPMFGALALGCLLSDWLELAATCWALATGTALLLLCAALQRRLGVVLAALLVMLTTGGWSAALRVAPPPIETCNDPSQLWQVRIATPPARLFGEHGELQQRCDVQVVAEQCGQAWQPRHGRLPLRLTSGPEVSRDDVILLRLQVRPNEPRRNPTDPDPFELARRFLWSGHGKVESQHVLVEVGGMLHGLDQARHRAARRFERVLPPRLAALAKALAIGDQGAVSLAQHDDWAAAGTAHLLSVSGLHVAIVAWLAYMMLRLVLALVPALAERLSLRRLAALASMPAVIAFCLWTGSQVPAVRSTVMTCAYLAGIALGRPSNALNALALAGVGLLVYDPTALYDVSFMLSFGGVAALMVLPRLPAAPSWLGRVRRALVGMLAASGVASAATAPVTAYYFGQISLAAPLVNLVAVPLGAAVATPLAMAFVVLAPLAGWCESTLGWMLHLVLHLLDALASWVASTGVAAIDVPQPQALEIAAYLALLTALVGALHRRRWGRLGVVALLVLAVSAGWRVWRLGGDGALHVQFPYVGQGDAAVLTLPHGGVMLVDAGGTWSKSGTDPGRTVLAPLLRRAGVRTIDLAVVTHPHPDHLGGFAYLAQHFRIRELWWNGAGEELQTQQRLLASVTGSGGLVHTAAELPALVEREGVTFEVLHPRPGAAGEGLSYYPALGDNDNSIVLRVRFGERTLLLSGDVEREAEQLLAPQLSATDVLKVPHHGSRTSSTAPLLAAVQPRLALISCGEDNRFGFPHAEVLERYAQRRIRVLRTDVDGLVEMRTEGARWQVRTERGGELRD